MNSLNAEMRAVHVSTYSGPLPHPDILREFEEIVPGSASRIFDQFEAQSLHRRTMEQKVISSNAFSQRVGTISASAIGLIGVAGGVWLAHEGRDVIGLSTLVTTIGGLVATYLFKRRSQDVERAQKQSQQATKQ